MGMKVEARYLSLHLDDFLREAWHVVEPSTPLQWGRHLDAICEHLEAVAAGKIRNLLITIPPGCTKSIACSVVYPAWVWTSNPGERFLTASNEEALAIRDAVACRRLIESEWFRERWGDVVRPTTDQNVKSWYENNRRGFRTTTTVGSNVTGKKGGTLICFPYNTVVVTARGEIPIGEIVEHDEVASFNHGTGQIEDRKVSRVMRSMGNANIVIKTVSGKGFRCTSGHPVFVVGRGYIDAKDVRIGDRVLRALPRGNRVGEAVLLDQVSRRMARLDEHAALRSVRKVVLHRSGASTARGNVLARMFSGGKTGNKITPMARWPSNHFVYHLWSESRGQEVGHRPKNMFARLLLENAGRPTETEDRDVVRRMWQTNGSNPMFCREAQVLLSSLREQCSIEVSSRGEERPVHSRGIGKRLSARVDEVAQAEDSATRRAEMPSVQLAPRDSWQVSVRPPYRLQQDESSRGESDYGVPFLPWEDAWVAGESFPMDQEVIVIDEVAFAGAIRGGDECVFNLEVDGNNNYFAAGILVHNCDDPNDARKAGSEAECRNVREWWRTAFYNRVNHARNARRIVIGQRTGEDDLQGYIIEGGAFEHLNLPEEFNPETAYKTSVGTDWRTTKGELLRPERFGAAEIAETIKVMGNRGYQTQHNQTALPEDGEMFKRSWFEVVQAAPVKAARVRGWDKGGGGETSDPSAGVLMAREPNGAFYIEDVIMGQWSAGERNAIMKQTAVVDAGLYKDYEIEIEQEPGSGGKESAEYSVKELAGYRVHINKPNTGDKSFRARPMAIQAEAKNIKIVAGAWNKKFLDELAAFPFGVHDDQVDAAVYAFNRLALVRKLTAWVL